MKWRLLVLGLLGMKLLLESSAGEPQCMRDSDCLQYRKCIFRRCQCEKKVTVSNSSFTCVPLDCEVDADCEPLIEYCTNNKKCDCKYGSRPVDTFSGATLCNPECVRDSQCPQPGACIQNMCNCAFGVAQLGNGTKQCVQCAQSAHCALQETCSNGDCTCNGNENCSCEDDSDCHLPHTRCTNQKCYCKYAVLALSALDKVTKCAECISDANCPAHSVCTDHVCSCKLSVLAYRSPGVVEECSECNIHSDCSVGMCKNNKCTCDHPSLKLPQNSAGLITKCMKCKLTTDCSQYSSCNRTTGLCHCDKGVIETRNDGLVLECVQCWANSDCYSNGQCINKKCVCAPGTYPSYGSNGRVLGCYLRECNDFTDCGPGAYCTSWYRCQCYNGHSIREDGKLKTCTRDRVMPTPPTPVNVPERDRGRLSHVIVMISLALASVAVAILVCAGVRKCVVKNQRRRCANDTQIPSPPLEEVPLTSGRRTRDSMPSRNTLHENYRVGLQASPQTSPDRTSVQPRSHGRTETVNPAPSSQRLIYPRPTPWRSFSEHSAPRPPLPHDVSSQRSPVQPNSQRRPETEFQTPVYPTPTTSVLPPPFSEDLPPAYNQCDAAPPSYEEATGHQATGKFLDGVV